MSRLMSVSHTELAVVERRKTVTRRLGWTFLKPGDRLTLCRKVMGRRHADGSVDPLVRLAEVQVERVWREPLEQIRHNVWDIEREGVEGIVTPAEFVEFYCRTFKVEPSTTVTRIEWSYL